jgi:hypothetical protein
MDKLTLETQIENARYHLVRTLAEDNIPEIERATDALNEARNRYERYKLQQGEKTLLEFA